MSTCLDVCGVFQIRIPELSAEEAEPQDRAWEECRREVERELALPVPNLLQVERIIQKACEGKVPDTEALLQRTLSTEELKTLWQNQKKWVKAGFDERIVETDPEAIKYSVDTGLVYTLAMFRDAIALEGDLLTIRAEGGKALFKVEGRWVGLKDFMGRVPYSKDEHRFIGWNCIHPDGFVRYDDTDYKALYPIARLKPDVHQRILRQAQGFWRGREDYDEGQEKPYVLQVMTTGRPCFPDSWLSRNADEHTPEHSSARLIGPDGALYSFGTKMRYADAAAVKKIANFLTTAETLVPVPDYEEPHRSNEKRVTSIALTKERFEAIRRYVETAAEGYPFNFAEANCARFVTALMGLAGVEVDIKMTPGEFIAGCLPSLTDVPIVGKPLHRVASAVVFVAVPIIDLMGALLRHIVPRCIQRVWTYVTQGVAQLLRMAGAFVMNLLALTILGAGRTLVPEGRRYRPNRGAEGEYALPTATCLMSWKDLFRTDALVCYHAMKLKQWQLKQRGSTTIFTDPRTGLSCVDPSAGVVVA